MGVLVYGQSIIYNFLNPAPQSGQRDGVKEDYYAWKIDLFGFFPLGEQLQERRD
jgi:hypothetical protein